MIIDADMVQAALPTGYALKTFDDIDSTNEEARRLVAAGKCAPQLIWAAQQHAGRGRQGRTWQSPEGNVYATLLEPLNEPVASAPCRTFMMSVAIAEAMRQMVPHSSVLIKWPNDVLLVGAKVSGILLELAEDASGATHIITGFGINVAAPPAAPLYPATYLRAHMPFLTPATVLASVLQEYFKLSAEYQQRGFKGIKQRWLELARGLGTMMVVQLNANEQASGRFVGLGDDGALLLEQADGRMVQIRAGDVLLA